MNKTNILEQQFTELLSYIENKRSEASQAVNEKQLCTAWVVGGYVSAKLKSEEWGSKVVTQFAEYVKVHAPEIKGFGRSNIYNMVMFYDEYSSPSFIAVVQQFLPQLITQTPSAQIEDAQIVQTAAGQLTTGNEFVQPVAGQIMQSQIALMPSFIKLTSYTNHIQILNFCSNHEQRLFYILYANKERLNKRELQRCISNDTYSNLLSKNKKMSAALLQSYPQAPILFKETLFVDFLGLPKRHSEPQLKKSILEHMKQFVLELGKDFLFVDQEYSLEVGASVFRADLLFFHRGLQCLVAIELKKNKFNPRDLGQLEFYLEALDRDVKRSNENPSIGIILCPEADDKVVEYAMSRSMSPTMIAEYKRLLIPKEKMQMLLKEYCDFIASATTPETLITKEEHEKA